MEKTYYCHKFWALIITLLLIISSGEIIYELYYSVASIIFLLLLITIFIIEKKYRYLPVEPSLYLGYLMIILLSNIIINNEPHIGHYIGVSINLIIVFLFAIIVDFNEFKDKYTKIMFVLCIISLIFYIIGLLYPSFVYLLPEIKYGSIDQYYKYAIIHSYRYEHDFIYLNNFSKNSSIFWEPGAYQFFLNLALYFEINKSKKSNLRLFIYLVGIITTFSTTGIIILVIILLFNIKFFSKARMKTMVLSLILLALIITCVYKNAGVYFSKFNQESDSYISYNSRMINTKKDFEILLKHPFGTGYTNYYLKYHPGGSENSITCMACIYGLLYAIPIFFSIFLLPFRMNSNYSRFIVFPLILYISCFSEKFFFTPILMYFSVLTNFKYSEQRGREFVENMTIVTNTRSHYREL